MSLIYAAFRHIRYHWSIIWVHWFRWSIVRFYWITLRLIGVKRRIWFLHICRNLKWLFSWELCPYIWLYMFECMMHILPFIMCYMLIYIYESKIKLIFINNFLQTIIKSFKLSKYYQNFFPKTSLLYYSKGVEWK